jgi:4-hydroxy-2-oxoheptanedioate aldolase
MTWARTRLACSIIRHFGIPPESQESDPFHILEEKDNVPSRSHEVPAHRIAGSWHCRARRHAIRKEAVKHLNPVVEKLAAGKPFIGFQTGDLSLQNARTLARAEIDYVYLEMEHGPMDFAGLHQFTIGIIDKAAILKKGNAQPNVAIFARFAPYGREQAQWFVKQALDIGLMGVIFNGIDNAEQALLAVRNMRYPQRKISKYPDPPGLRGYAPGIAVWWWGVSAAEYERRADLWPLNPDGDLLAIMMIETTEGLKNADAIAAVPGVGAIFVGAGGDLHQ